MIEKIKKEREQITKIVSLFLLSVWLMRWWSGLLVYQLRDAPFVSVEADNSFWLFHALAIPFFAIHSDFGWLIDFVWLGAVLWLIFANYARWVGIALVMAFWSYFFIYNSVATHHEHTLVGLLFFTILINIQDSKRFVLTFVGLRYYAVFVLFSAGFWKLWRGSLFLPHQMSEILKRQHLEYLIENPDNAYSQFITYLIQNPQISNWFWYLGSGLELFFIIGFFTRKWDKLLGVLFLAFFAMDYFLMHLCFVEICIFLLVFYPWKGIYQEFETIKHED